LAGGTKSDYSSQILECTHPQRQFLTAVRNDDTVITL